MAGWLCGAQSRSPSAVRRALRTGYQRRTTVLLLLLYIVPYSTLYNTILYGTDDTVLYCTVLNRVPYRTVAPRRAHACARGRTRPRRAARATRARDVRSAVARRQCPLHFPQEPHDTRHSVIFMLHRPHAHAPTAPTTAPLRPPRPRSPYPETASRQHDPPYWRSRPSHVSIRSAL